MSQSELPPNMRRSEWAKFLAGFEYTFSGLWYALRTQRNARVHVSIAMLVIIAGIVLRISAVEFAILFITISSVFIAEMFNTVLALCVAVAPATYNPSPRIPKAFTPGASR